MRKDKQPEQIPAGNLIVIEGHFDNLRDEQFLSLVAKLKSDGHDVVSFAFPRLETNASHFIKQYTNGHYGSPKDIGPYTSSLFYSLDRFEAGFEIRNALKAGKVVIINKYTASNMAQQGAKFPSPEQRRGYYLWLENLEYEMLKIPRPDKSFVLRGVDSNDLLTQVYDELCLLFPKDFIRVDCSRDGELLEHDTIHNLLYRSVEAFLPVLQPSPTKRETDTDETTPKTDGPTAVVSLYDAMYHPKTDFFELIGDHERRYAVPKLSKATTKIYQEGMDELFRAYDRMIKRAKSTTTKKIIQNVLPLSAHFSSPATATHTTHMPESVLAMFAQKELGGQLDGETRSVQLVSCTPRNEFDLIPSILYRYAGQSLEQIHQALNTLTYIQKEKILNTYLTSSDSAIEGARYNLDCIIDHNLFDIIRSMSLVTNVSWQAPTPRYGYEVPEQIETEGMTEEFEGCFDLSLRLYSLLQSEQPHAAPFATLRGHKLRCNFEISTRGLQDLTASLAKVNMHSVFLDQIKQAVGEAHPLTADNL